MVCTKWRCGFVLVFYIVLNVVIAADNATAKVPEISQNAIKRPGALASLVKMFIDVPMGLVEAFKDGADAIETTVVAIMKAIF